MGSRYFLNGRLPPGAIEAVNVGKNYDQKIGWLRDLSSKFGDTSLDDDRPDDEDTEDDNAQRNHVHDGSWALKNVSFSVAPGERIAIFGAAGAGKSTLVRILAGIIPPTEGRVEGTGVSILLSSLENIIMPDKSCYENMVVMCELLRVPKKVLSDNLTSLIAFSDMDGHIYKDARSCTKTMYQQITISMALHVEPAIMLVDDSIGIKNPEFAAKVMEKIQTLSSDGMSLIFTTRDIKIKKLCDRGIVLEKGSIFFDGNIDDAIQQISQAKSGANNVQIG